MEWISASYPHVVEFYLVGKDRLRKTKQGDKVCVASPAIVQPLPFAF